MKDEKILLFTGILAAYREPVFRSLGEQSPLCVLLSGTNALRRRTVEPTGETPTRYVHLKRRQFRIGSQYVEFLPDLKKELRSHPADVYIIPDSPREYHSVARIFRFARRRNSAVVCWSEYNESALRYSGAPRLVQRIQKKYYRRADAFLASGIQTRDYLRTHGVEGSCIVTGPQCMPAELLARVPSKHPDPRIEDKRIWLFVGYLDELKGVQHLIRAFFRFATEEDHLVIVGSGRYERYLRTLSGRDHRIHFTGHIEGNGKSAWYQAADVFVFPTLRDAWGLVINEAMYFGLPVIASSAAGCVHDLVLHGKTGLVVPPGDEQALVAACRHLRDDPELANRLGENGKDHVGQYSVAATVKAFRDAMESALVHRRASLSIRQRVSKGKR